MYTKYIHDYEIPIISILNVSINNSKIGDNLCTQLCTTYLLYSKLTKDISHRVIYVRIKPSNSQVTYMCVIF